MIYVLIVLSLLAIAALIALTIYAVIGPAPRNHR